MTSMIGDILEIAMLLCFAASWPFNIHRSWVSRTAVGKSIMFEIIVEIGYVCGIGSHIANDEINSVIAFYVLDIILVAIDMGLYFRNRKLDAERVKAMKLDGEQ